MDVFVGGVVPDSLSFELKGVEVASGFEMTLERERKGRRGQLLDASKREERRRERRRKRK